MAANYSMSWDTATPRYTAASFANEASISQKGCWRTNGSGVHTAVQVTGGIACGTQAGSNGYDDSYAFVNGVWQPNQTVSAVINLEAGITAAYAEVEILLRWVDGPGFSYGYECNLSFIGQYAEIIKWPKTGKGLTSGDFTWVSSGNPVSAGVHHGDVFSATITGSSIVVKLNGSTIASGTDTEFTKGAPGLGFYAEGAAVGKKFGFSNWNASSS